jgi:hypothetical protein
MKWLLHVTCNIMHSTVSVVCWMGLVHQNKLERVQCVTLTIMLNNFTEQS